MYDDRIWLKTDTDNDTTAGCGYALSQGDDRMQSCLASNDFRVIACISVSNECILP